MPTAEEVIETRNQVKKWYENFLRSQGHPTISVNLILDRTSYDIMLDEYKKDHPGTWTGPYSSY